MVTYAKRMARPAKTDGGAKRNPGRTRERILSAALKEFAAKGFAGARVDADRAAGGDQQADALPLFRRQGKSVPRRPAPENRRAARVGANLSSDPAERLPFWFKTACDDADWIRLLEWEALQSGGKKVIDEDERRALSADWLKRLAAAAGARGIVIRL